MTWATEQPGLTHLGLFIIVFFFAPGSSWMTTRRLEDDGYSMFVVCCRKTGRDPDLRF